MEEWEHKRLVLVGTALAGAGVAAFLLSRTKPKSLLEAVRAGSIGLDELKGPHLDWESDEDSNTALLLAVKLGHEKIARDLLAHGSNIEVCNRYEWNVLHLGAYSGASESFMEFLISKGADVNAVDHNGWIPLHVAISTGNAELATLLLKNGSGVNTQNKKGQTPMFIAANNGHTSIVKTLFEYNANPIIRTAQTLETPLHAATWNKRLEIIEILLQKDPDLLKIPMTDGTLPIHVAAATLDISLVKLLIKYGGNPKETKRDGSGCVHIVILQGESEKSLKMLEFLLQECDCPLTGSDKFGTTALHHACRNEQTKIVAMLLEHGFPVDLPDNDGMTALHAACTTWKEKDQLTGKEGETLVAIYKLLRAHGADLYKVDKVGALPIHHAVCKAYNLELVQEMLKEDPNLAFATENSERTPLHLASHMYKNENYIRLLTDVMKKINPSFFDNFDPKHRVDYQINQVPSSLSEEEKSKVLEQNVSVTKVAQNIREGKYNKIVVLSGAGISTSCGIADFRSPGSGIYADPKLKAILGVESISDAFSMSAFSHNPRLFFYVLKHVFSPLAAGKYQPTTAHKMISYLHQKDLLLRNFTQNIDTLETVAGVPPEKVVEAHGSINTATCSKCSKKCLDMDNFWKNVNEDVLPTCQFCEGILQPDIVLFGQGLPSRFFDCADDLKECDLLIVMGTSLKVYPFAGLVNSVRDDVPRLLFNNEAVGPFTKGVQEKIQDGGLVQVTPGAPGTYRDVAIIGDIDQAVVEFSKLCGWDDLA
eukprot:TRINITY_DN4889_c0_g1_i14.p1 TRINITY_DN4889_c0_g1~~TRINITY_DN4889_c0_g1_i14.p1  ORF type:complete len:779 (+),score=128.09 TRINITY_DN4889_c0_g1_i14:40-2337(+)